MNHSSLAELQLALQHYLLDQTSNINALTSETANFSREQRLRIYRSAYSARLLEVLSNDYPALAIFLGEDNFTHVILEYIHQHPSQHASLRWLGEKLPAFLSNHQQFGQQISAIELADFEWTQTTAFDAQDCNPASMDDLHSIPHSHWPRMRLELQPGLQIKSYTSNAPDIWYGLIHRNQAIAETISQQLQHWAIWRKDLQVIYRPLDEIEVECLRTFQRNENFTDVCEVLSRQIADETVPLQAVQYLQQWLQEGLVAKIG